MAVKIISVEKGSICQKIGIKSNDIFVSINGNEIVDIFDYQFYAAESKLEIIVERNGAILTFKVKKEPLDDLGLEFSSYLMDEQRRCRNNCIF